jgi:cytoskeleton protein RodZ
VLQVCYNRRPWTDPPGTIIFPAAHVIDKVKGPAVATNDDIPDQPAASGDPVPPPPPAAGLGATLRAAREATGKDIATVATELCIRQPYLQALESGKHKNLPGITYAIGFLRSYAEFLGLDGEEMVRRFRQEAADDLHARAALAFPSPVSEGRIPTGGILFLGLILAAAAYGGWFWMGSREPRMAEAVPALPDRLQTVLATPAAIGKPDEPAKAEPSPAAEAPAKVEAPPAEPPKPVEAVKPPEPVKPVEAVKPPEPVKPVEAVKPPEPVKPAEAVKPPEPVKPVEAVKPPEPVKPAEAVKPPEPVKPAEAVKPPEPPKPAEPAAAPPPAEPERGSGRVVLSAAGQDCWIRVRELDGQLLTSKLLRRGESWVVPNRPGLSLMVGNAAALTVTVDGKRLPPLGKFGEVLKNVSLDPAKLVPPKEPPPAAPGPAEPARAAE